VNEESGETKLIRQIDRMFHDKCVVMQAAWIEWKHGKGADAAMQWIENTLAGPGLIPSPDEPWATEAQAYFDANRSDPFPQCYCGRPSHIAHMSAGYCCDEHYRIGSAKAKDSPATAREGG